ncbi:MAG TPA: aspartate-semialdehyde dehydrogenase [Dictyoglomaceae bacterium]|nr:aspartate-semialdehyde dehydrogenase [Dictyoglomaceae bacterium]HOL38968.1 aspartate-semialdehyde dehydrogenase [Dictyoglomaceae bacterium]HOP94844.1 aspartate-semialdehyde dehydrogenase [Dictyoglomaceae bacterium]HPP15615.1 aspartate-semialdehyde dehydrogenase [Dictyoglomaceae bacterium]HPU43518.1 aspartate-semialdehyde dehydrogenase [Dictyoglomaceae bacterium]
MGYKIAVVGATGVVGQEMLKILWERKIPISEIYAFASEKSEGTHVNFGEEKIKVEKADVSNISKADFALFSIGEDISLELAPKVAQKGTIIIDNSNAFRMDPNVPLVIPEINPEDLNNHKNIIANPNCSTIQMLVALNPLHKKWKLKRIFVATYQSVSGKGKDAINELLQSTEAYLKGQDISPTVFPYPIAFNLIPHIDSFEEGNYTREEIKMVRETHKILHDSSIKVSPTCVRAPIIRGHSEAILAEFEREFTLKEVYETLEKAPGVKVIDNPKEKKYPMPFYCNGKDDVFVGRLREDLFEPKAINIWVVSDNIRKGAALNAVQILERLIM